MPYVTPIGARLARETVEREHYLHRKPAVSAAFGLWDDFSLVGVLTFGCPASREMLKSACPGLPEAVTELNRLWIDDRMPRNTASWFVSRALKALGPRIVVSYADTVQGHTGAVYRALNFNYAGWTDMERRSARWDYIPQNNPTAHSRDAGRHGYSHRIQRKPKVRYWTTTGNKTEREFLASACAWAVMSWSDYPAPRGHISLDGYRKMRASGTNPSI